MTTLAFTIAVLLVMVNMQRGRELMRLRRCVRCNAHPWDRHEKDCPHRGRW
jgi:hypothetical protein